MTEKDNIFNRPDTDTTPTNSGGGNYVNKKGSVYDLPVKDFSPAFVKYIMENPDIAKGKNIRLPNDLHSLIKVCTDIDPSADKIYELVLTAFMSYLDEPKNKQMKKEVVGRLQLMKNNKLI